MYRRPRHSMYAAASAGLEPRRACGDRSLRAQCSADGSIPVNNPPRIEYHGHMAEATLLENTARERSGEQSSGVSGTALEEEVTSAATDARFFGLYQGTPAIVYGPICEGHPWFDERVDLDSLQTVTKTMALFLADWCGVGRGQHERVRVDGERLWSLADGNWNLRSHAGRWVSTIALTVEDEQARDRFAAGRKRWAPASPSIVSAMFADAKATIDAAPRRRRQSSRYGADRQQIRWRAWGGRKDRGAAPPRRAVDQDKAPVEVVVWTNEGDQVFADDTGIFSVW